MKLTEITDSAQRERLASLFPDGITHFSMLGGTVKGAVLSGTVMVTQARLNHGLGIIESLALSQGLIAGGLISTTIKEGAKIHLRMDCSGALRGFSIDTDWQGNVRGYLFNDSIYIDKAPDSFDLKPFIGSGTLSVTRHAGKGDPYTGHIQLVHGRIAEDITEYFLKSEQANTALSLGVRFDKQGNIAGAGGLFFQAMPGAKDADMEDIEDWMREVPSLGNYFSEGKSRGDFLHEWFRNFDVDILAESAVRFSCSCSKERFASYIKALGRDELESMILCSPFPMDIRCHYCNSSYGFSKEDLEGML